MLEQILGGSRLVNRNITAGAGRTSMRLEPEVWDALREICLREGMELRDLIKMVERTAPPGGRTSAVRVHVLQYYRTAATAEGHIEAGHGTTTATGPMPLISEIEVENSLEA
jgi:predicted DNA-binding ribbon-helix-helix protein